MKAKPSIHFHSSDDRFCGDQQSARRFSLDPNEVTCAACQRRDCFTLSKRATKYEARLKR